MRRAIARGKIVYLTAEGHRRIIPNEKPEKLGKRPFLVVQRDIANAESEYTVVVGLTTADVRNKSKSRPQNRTSVDVFLPKSNGVANEDCIADCGSLYTVHDKEIHNVFSGVYGNKEMEEISNALLLALDLDPDGILCSREYFVR